MESLVSLAVVQEASLFPVDPGEVCRMVDMEYEPETEHLSLSNSHSEDNSDNPEEPIMDQADIVNNNIGDLETIAEVLETMESHMAPSEKVSIGEEIDLEEKAEALLMDDISDKDELNNSGKEGSSEEVCTEQLYDTMSEKSSQSSLTSCSISSSSSAQITPATSRPETPLAETLVENCVQHPAESMQQEMFLEGLNLITHATLKHNRENKKVERRRRKTANPKYNRNGFIDLSHMGKRHRKHEEALEALQRSLEAPISPMVPKISKDKCVVCESLGGNLTCETCGMRVHSDCIKVSGTKAPIPAFLPKCPDCITAANVALWEPELQYFATISSTISTAIKRKPPAKHKKAKKPKRDSPQKQVVPERQVVCFENETVANGETKTLKFSLSKPIIADRSGASNSTSPAKPAPKKKSKVSGVKAKTLSVTGNGTESSTKPVHSTKSATLMEAGSETAGPARVKPPPIRSVSRLPKQTVSPISVEQTIMAMRSAARSVMSSSGIPKVLLAATASSSENIPGTTVTLTASTIPNDQVSPKADVQPNEFSGSGNETNHENIAPAVTCAAPPVEIN